MSWPTPESVLQEILERERDEEKRARRRIVWAREHEEKAALGQAKVIAAMQDAQRSWHHDLSR